MHCAWGECLTCPTLVTALCAGTLFYKTQHLKNLTYVTKTTEIKARAGMFNFFSKIYKLQSAKTHVVVYRHIYRITEHLIHLLYMGYNDSSQSDWIN
jgi:hypothetical protein